ncbi:MAG: CHAT domain-containing protein [Leptolyngbya sp. SIO1E4]|nr:CHAT domain-containing protein [Leptolyngbya sp. SIO1E4]
MGRCRRWLRLLGIAIAIAMILPSLTQSVAVAMRPVSAAPAFASIDVAQTAVESLIQQADEQFYNRDYTSAERNYQSALEQLQQTHPDAADIPLITHNLARTYLLTAQYTRALPLLEALDRAGQATTNGLNNLALAHFYLGNYAAAETVLTRVLTAWDAIRSRDDLDDLDKVTLFEQQAHSYELMQRTLVAQGKTDAALAMSERARARALVERLVQQQSGDPLPPPLTVPQIQEIAHQQNTTLVIYSVLGNGYRILGNEVETETDLLTWIVPPQGPIYFQTTPLSPFWGGTAPLRALSPLESLLQQTQVALGVASRGVGVVANERRVTDGLPPASPLPMRSLYEILIAPIAPQLPAAPEALVTFIPQGPLFLVPFAALPSPEGTYLIDHHAISIAPSVQALALAAQADGGATGRLVVGNPVTMPRLPADMDTLPQHLPPLPGAEQEAQAIATLLNTVPLVREQATETAVVQQMPQQEIIHLATHGLLNLDSRLNEFGLPTDPNAQTATDAQVYVNPGAVIVGDNVSVGGVDTRVSLARERVVRVSAPGVLALAPSSTDDGWLTAEEIASLDLQADLVILSACDTGRGRITGDGVVGLTRAFLAAGADTVVVSLWQVPDIPTAALMVAFYEQLAQVQNKAQALQQAMQITKQQFPDPLNWSAFVLVGETS